MGKTVGVFPSVLLLTIEENRTHKRFANNHSEDLNKWQIFGAVQQPSPKENLGGY